MANLPGTRIRSNNIFGSTTDNPLTSGAALFNSPSLADMPAVTAGNHLIVTLDPLRQYGFPEIVMVTAHTASSTVASIQRGMYGTTPRTHTSGTFWAHAGVVEDFVPILTSVTRPADPYRGQMIFETDTNTFTARDTSDVWQSVLTLGSWISYTPTFTNLTVGAGALQAAYTKIGRTVHYRIKWGFGAGSAVGTGPSFTLPIAPAATYVSNYPMTSDVKILDAGTDVFLGTTEFSSGSTVVILVAGAGGTYVNRTSITSTVPMTWTTGDTLFVTGTYEAAS